MSDAFTQNKRRTGKGVSYFLINSGFAALFAFGLFALGRNDCYTMKGSDVPVNPAVIPEGTRINNVTAWFNATLTLGFIFYTAAAVSSLGYLTLDARLQNFSAYTEKLSRILTYTVFIAVHVMRLSHTGSVCAGDYLPAEEFSNDEVRKNYMVNTGRFFMMYIILGWTVVPIMLIVMVCLKGDKWAALALDAPK